MSIESVRRDTWVCDECGKREELEHNRHPRGWVECQVRITTDRPGTIYTDRRTHEFHACGDECTVTLLRIPLDRAREAETK